MNSYRLQAASCRVRRKTTVARPCRLKSFCLSFIVSRLLYVPSPHFQVLCIVPAPTLDDGIRRRAEASSSQETGRIHHSSFIVHQSPTVFNFDYDGLRRGYYSDAYFLNGVRVLSKLAESGMAFHGRCLRANLAGLDLSSVQSGDVEVEMQYFAKREPWCIAAGIDAAIAILRECTGYFENGTFINTAGKLEIDAMPEGSRLPPRCPALKVRGRYRDFGAHETTTLGVLSRASLIATNVYRVLEASNGTPVFFFPARFDAYTTQALDGYAYKIAIDAYNREHGAGLEPLVSTDAQARWWQGRGGGTVAHAFILCFLGDTAEAMLAFAQHMPPDVQRIALVDTNNDCVSDTATTAKVLFRRFMELMERGETTEAEKFRLFGVRLDTAGDVRDASVSPLGEPPLDLGVCPRLVVNVRRCLDALHESAGIPDRWRPAARDYFQAVRIVASGGFDDRKVALFTRLGVPVDIYGIGSYFRSGQNDFTADIVRVKIGGTWHDMAKVGRGPWENPDLRRVQ